MRSREKIDYFAFHCSLLKTYLLVEINFQHFYTPLKQVILQHHSGYMLVLLVFVITVRNLSVLLLRSAQAVSTFQRVNWLGCHD